MSNLIDFKMRLIQCLRNRDVELSEDLYRRMGPCDTVSKLNIFFHSVLAQYTVDTMDLRASLPVTDDFDIWYNQFLSKVFPFIVKRRLPPFTHTEGGSLYTCRAVSQ